MKKSRVPERFGWVILLAISLVGSALVLFVTRNGAAATGDSVWYLQGAENILKGYGYGILRSDGWQPTTLYPPFYSIVLAGLGISGISIFTLAGIFNAVLFGANIFLAGWLVYRLTGSAIASALVSLFNLLCIDLFILHAWVMTEPLYITLTLLCFLAFLQYQQKNHWPALALAGLAAGLSVVTRFVGISLVAAACLWVLFFGDGSKIRRLVKAVILGVLGSLPALFYFVRNAALTDSVAGRSAMVFRTLPIENYTDMALTITAWFFPGLAYRLSPGHLHLASIGLVLLAAISFVLSVRLFARSKDKHERDYTRFEYLLSIYFAVYVFTFMASIYFSLAGSPASWTATQISRYLLPVFPVFVILAALVYFRLQRALSGKGKFYRQAATALALAFLALYVYTFAGLRNKHIYLGYTEIRNDYPDLMAEIEAIPPSRPIIASNYELGYFLTERPVYSMPGEGDELTGEANPDLPQLLENVVELLDQGAILIVYRPNLDERLYFDPLLNDLVMLSTYENNWMSITLYSKSGQ